MNVYRSCFFFQDLLIISSNHLLIQKLSLVTNDMDEITVYALCLSNMSYINICNRMVQKIFVIKLVILKLCVNFKNSRFKCNILN